MTRLTNTSSDRSPITTRSRRDTRQCRSPWRPLSRKRSIVRGRRRCCSPGRSEEHTSELQSHHDLVCRLLLEKKKKKKKQTEIKKKKKKTKRINKKQKQ